MGRQSSNAVGIQIGVLLLIFLVMLPWFGHAARKKMAVPGRVKMALVGVIEESKNLHGALVERNRGQVDLVTRRLIKRISLARQSVGDETHLLRILMAAERQLSQGLVNPGKDGRRLAYSEAFRQIVQLPQLYDIGRYRMYFCTQDQTVWVQKPTAPRNPFNPEKYLRCGKQIAS